MLTDENPRSGPALPPLPGAHVRLWCAIQGFLERVGALQPCKSAFFSARIMHALPADLTLCHGRQPQRAPRRSSTLIARGGHMHLV